MRECGVWQDHHEVHLGASGVGPLLDLGGTRESTTTPHYNGTTFLTEVLCLKWCDHSRIIRTLPKPRCLKFSISLSKSPERAQYPSGLWRCKIHKRCAAVYSSVTHLFNRQIMRATSLLTGVGTESGRRSTRKSAQEISPRSRLRYPAHALDSHWSATHARKPRRW